MNFTHAGELRVVLPEKLYPHFGKHPIFPTCIEANRPQVEVELKANETTFAGGG